MRRTPKTKLVASTLVVVLTMVGLPNQPHRRRRIMADHKAPKKEWTKPGVRRLEGAEAERALAILMKHGLDQETARFRKAS